MPTPKPGTRKNAAMGRVDITPAPAVAPPPPTPDPPYLAALIPAHSRCWENSGWQAFIHEWRLSALEHNGTQSGHLAYCVHCLARLWIPS